VLIACGVDIVRVDRLDSWASFSDERLLHVFTVAEIAVIRGENGWSSQRAAAYFAVKEAFYKALSNALVGTGLLKEKIFFGHVCPLIQIRKNEWGIPELEVDWQGISQRAGFPCVWQVHCSYAHENKFAIAYVNLTNSRTS